MCWGEGSFFKGREVDLMASGSPFRLQAFIITEGPGSQKSVNSIPSPNIPGSSEGNSAEGQSPTLATSR